MRGLDWSQCHAVESIPRKVSGAWVFRDTRLPVATVIENLEDLSVEEVMEQCDVTRDQINAVLEFVGQSLRDVAPPPPTLHDAAGLFDHGTPRGLMHPKTTSRLRSLRAEKGWSTVYCLRPLRKRGLTFYITTDGKMRYQ